MFYAELSSRALIRLSGEDRIAFLQGVITNDAEMLARGEAIYAALLSPQGKFLHDFFLVPSGENILIDCEKNRIDDLIARLGKYKLRSKIALEKTGEKIFAYWGEGAPPSQPLTYQDPRLAALGWRMIGANPPGAPVDFLQYDRMRIALGVPDGSRDMIVEKSILLEFGFEELHGVDFEKGCYVGQEVTARSKHRAQLKKGLFQIEAESALPAGGTPITANGAPAGEMRSSSGNIGLAILRFEEAAAGKLEAAGLEICAQRPKWMI